VKSYLPKALAAILLAALLCVPATASATKHHARHVKKGVHHARTHAARRHKRHHKHHAGVHASHLRPATASDYCPGANLKPQAENLESVRAATLCLINNERLRAGEQPLVESPALDSSASSHSHDMLVHGYFEHVSPGGQTLLARVRASGFIPGGHVGYTLGENIAWGTLWLATPRSIVEAWMASPGHRANILNRAFHDTGIGIVAAVPRSMSGGLAGGMYTQDFGTIIG
jgi:uncharacterized protein YkwD